MKISLREAADILGVSHDTVLRMIDDGVLQGYKKNPGSLRSAYQVEKKDVMKLKEQQKEVVGKV